MSSKGDSQSATNNSGGNPAECKPLLDAATSELFQTNAFRITGLSVDATAREIARREDKLKRLDGLERLGITTETEKQKLMEQLGWSGSGQASAFILKVPPAVDQLRGAFQKLNKSPDRRLIDEFFWFWPEEFGKSTSDPGIQALMAGKAYAAERIWVDAETGNTENVVAKHNLAVLWHLRALDLENDWIGQDLDAKARCEIEVAWTNALRRWQALGTHDALWDRVASRIKQIDDARLTTGFGRRMRLTLPLALNKINAELALAHAKAGNTELAKAHVQFMRETSRGSDDLAKVGELVLAPLISRVREQMNLADKRIATNPEMAGQAARDLIAGARLLVDLSNLFFGEAEHPAKDLQWDVSRSLDRLGDVLLARRQFQEASDAFQQSVVICKRLLQRDTSNAVWQRGLSVYYNKLGDALVAQGNLHDALNACQQSLAIIAQLAEQNKSNAGWQRDLWFSYDKVGGVLTAQGKLQQALDSYRRSLAIVNQLAEQDKSNAGWQRDLWLSFNHLGRVFEAQGKLQEALDTYWQSLVIIKHLAEQDSSNAGWQRDLWLNFCDIGDVTKAQGRLQEALDVYQEGLVIIKDLVGQDTSNADWQWDLKVSCSRIWAALTRLLEQISQSAATPSERLKQFQNQATPRMVPGIFDLDANVCLRNSLFNKAAALLKDIAVEAWQKFNDKSTALKANELALEYAQDSELKQTLSGLRDVLWPK